MADDAGNIDETHDPEARSWVESANDLNTDFPIQNLPYARVWDEEAETEHFGVMIGDSLLAFDELLMTRESDLLAEAFYSEFYVAGSSAEERTSVRRHLFKMLRTGSGRDSAKDRAAIQASLIPIGPNHTLLPAFDILNYTDFYASIHHATNVGGMFRPDNPLLPNYKWVPIGYHGRASSIVPTEAAIVRPNGQTKADDAAAPSFGPCKMLDHELEVGVIVAEGEELGTPVHISRARERMVGLTLVNDWSARDMQKWEYQPLGPFLAKNFATTVGCLLYTSPSPRD